MNDVFTVEKYQDFFTKKVFIKWKYRGITYGVAAEEAFKKMTTDELCEFFTFLLNDVAKMLLSEGKKGNAN